MNTQSGPRSHAQVRLGRGHRFPAQDSGFSSRPGAGIAAHPTPLTGGSGAPPNSPRPREGEERAVSGGPSTRGGLAACPQLPASASPPHGPRNRPRRWAGDRSSLRHGEWGSFCSLEGSPTPDKRPDPRPTVASTRSRRASGACARGCPAPSRRCRALNPRASNWEFGVQLGPASRGRGVGRAPLNAKAWCPETRYPEARPGAVPPAAPESRRGSRAPPGAAPRRPSSAAAAGAWPGGRIRRPALPSCAESAASRSLHPAPARRGASWGPALKETPSHFPVADSENNSRRGARCLQTENLGAKWTLAE